MITLEDAKKIIEKSEPNMEYVIEEDAENWVAIFIPPRLPNDRPFIGLCDLYINKITGQTKEYPSFMRGINK